VAKAMGILVFGVATKSFKFEGKKRGKPAEDGVGQCEASVGMHRSGPGHGS